MRLKLREEDILKQIRQYSELYFGVHLYRIRENPWTSEKGLPDLMGWRKTIDSFLRIISVPVFVEVKGPKGKKRPDQIAFIEKARADGCVAMFADSLESFIAGMNGFGIYGRGGK